MTYLKRLVLFCLQQVFEICVSFITCQSCEVVIISPQKKYGGQNTLCPSYFRESREGMSTCQPYVGVFVAVVKWTSWPWSRSSRWIAPSWKNASRRWRKRSRTARRSTRRSWNSRTRSRSKPRTSTCRSPSKRRKGEGYSASYMSTRREALYNLGSGSWLAWANDTAAHRTSTDRQSFRASARWASIRSDQNTLHFHRRSCR